MAASTFVRRTAVGAFILAVTLTAIRAARRRRRLWEADGHGIDLESLAEAVLPYPRQDVYDLLIDPTRLADALGLDARTDVLDGERWVWTLPGPNGTELVCPVEVTSSTPGMVVVWRAEGAPLPHEGTAWLEPADADEATALTVRLRYRWSPVRAREEGVSKDAVAERLTDAVARLQSLTGSGPVRP